MPTVVGIFDSQKHAEDAVLGLVAAGFERFDVRIISDAVGLAEQGVEESEADCYAEGLRRGGTVVAVRCHPQAVGKAAEAMRRMGAVDVSAKPGAKRMEQVQPFGEMTEKASMWGMRAGETQLERDEELDGRERSEERMGDMDRVYGAGIEQKGEVRKEKSEFRNPNSEKKIEKSDE